MQLNVTGHNLEVTPALDDRVQKRMKRLSKNFDFVDSANVTLSVESHYHIAEAAAFINGTKLFADAKEDDMYKAIDQMMDKLTRQVRRHKEKTRDHHARDVEHNVA